MNQSNCRMSKRYKSFYLKLDDAEFLRSYSIVTCKFAQCPLRITSKCAIYLSPCPYGQEKPYGTQIPPGLSLLDVDSGEIVVIGEYVYIPHPFVNDIPGVPFKKKGQQITNFIRTLDLLKKGVIDRILTYTPVFKTEDDEVVVSKIYPNYWVPVIRDRFQELGFIPKS